MALPSDEEIRAKTLDEAKEWGNPRCAFAQKGLSLANLAYADHATRDQYVAEIYFEGVFPLAADGGYDVSKADYSAAYQMAAAQSSCGITTEAIWRYAGVDDPVIYEFYQGRVWRGKYAVKQEYEFAKSVGAWVSGLPWRRGTPFPEQGDALIIGDNTPAMARGGVTNFQHELTALCWIEGPRGALLSSIDGGQPGIALRTRQLIEVFPGGGDTGELWCGQVDPSLGYAPTSADGRPLIGRRCIGFTDVTKLPYRADKPPACEGQGLLASLGSAGGGLVGKVAKGLFVGAAVLGGVHLGALALGVRSPLPIPWPRRR